MIVSSRQKIILLVMLALTIRPDYGNCQVVDSTSTLSAITSTTIVENSTRFMQEFKKSPLQYEFSMSAKRYIEAKEADVLSTSSNGFAQVLYKHVHAATFNNNGEMVSIPQEVSFEPDTGRVFTDFQTTGIVVKNAAQFFMQAYMFQPGTVHTNEITVAFDGNETKIIKRSLNNRQPGSQEEYYARIFKGLHLPFALPLQPRELYIEPQKDLSKFIITDQTPQILRMIAQGKYSRATLELNPSAGYMKQLYELVKANSVVRKYYEEPITYADVTLPQVIGEKIVASDGRTIRDVRTVFRYQRLDKLKLQERLSIPVKRSNTQSDPLIDGAKATTLE